MASTPTPAQQTDHTPTWTFVEETEYTSAHLRREVDGRCASAGDEFVLASAHAALQAENERLRTEISSAISSMDGLVWELGKSDCAGMASDIADELRAALIPRLDGEGRCSCGMGDASAGLHAAECDKAIKATP